MTDEERSTIATQLLELQRVDTDVDQLAHRRDRLPEREALDAASEQLATWERQRVAFQQRLDELTGVIEQAEAASAEHAQHKTRLQEQMKTVIAPREAEALMHEIATIDEHVDALDTTELEALEEQAALDDTLTAHLGNEATLRASVDEAQAIVDAATAEIDAQLATLATERESARGALSESVWGRYDRVRASSGVAVANLVGHRCNGCHLDLSAAEVDDVKDDAAAADGVADCPQCGRILVV